MSSSTNLHVGRPGRGACLGLLAALLLLGVRPAHSQTPVPRGVLQGRVIDATTQAPLPGAGVLIEGTTTGAATDADGRFEIAGLAPGTYRVQARFLGYQSRTATEVVVQPSRPTFVLFELEERALETDGVEVTAAAFDVPADAPTSVRVLGAEEVRRTPGGQNDISRALLSLPGVVGGIDSRNDLLVRGGGPGENAYFLDGIEIPQINHFATQGATGGALGLVNIDFIRETSFYTGGFPVRYGDALSSVLLIENRPGSPRLAGDFTVGAVETALTLDGPLTPRASWLASVRRSYLQFLFQALGLPIRPSYWDAQLRVQVDPGPRDRIVAVGLGALDDFDLAPPGPDAGFETKEIAERVLDNDQRSYTVGASWRRLFPGGFFTAALSRSVTDFDFEDVDKEGTVALRNASVEAFNRGRIDGDLRIGPRLTLGAGAGATHTGIRTTFFQDGDTPGTTFGEDLRFDNALTFWKAFGYVQLTTRLARERLTLTGGLRADGNTFLDRKAYVSPRLSASLALAPHWTLNAATGVFHQTPPLIALAVQDEAGTFVNRGLPLLRAVHYVGGVAWQARPSLRLTLEGFFKDYDDYPVSASDPRLSLANLGGDYGFVGAEPLLGVGEGRSYGAEASAQKKLVERFTAQAAYTLAWSAFSGSDGVYKPSAWDARHTVSLTTGYRIGRSWEIGLKWRYVSGRAYTPLDPVRSAEEYARTGRGVPDYDRLGTLRTPAYHRLDARVDRRFSFQGWNAVVYLDVQNLYNRRNLAGYTYTTDPDVPDGRRPIENVGLLPNFGFSIEW